MSVALSREPGRRRTATPVAHFALRRLLDAIGQPPIVFELWDGSLVAGTQPARARLRVRSRAALLRMLRNPGLGFGEAYVDGGLEVEGDLCDCIEAVFRTWRTAPGLAGALLDLLGARRRRNTRTRARRNVHHHYDLGNDFYARWLDADLVYTCAYFESRGATLEQAQQAKLEHVCRKLRLAPGESVLEAGCGWGALALYMAERHGVRVRAFNVSQQQIRFAREAAERRGLAGRVEFVQDDFRAARGRYDAFVSIGMLEHVGRADYAALGALVERTLAPDGRGLLHFIGHARPWRMNPWLEQTIFPGAYIPALSEVLPLLEQHDLVVADVENLREHYALTLQHWLARFEGSRDWVAARYDARFVRSWRLYLASSQAAFRAGSCQLFQLLFERAGQPRLPLTRADLYAEP